MANLEIKDGASAQKYLKASGTGSDGDPFVPQHLESNSATIASRLATLAGAVAGTELQVDVVSMPTTVVSDGGSSVTVDGSVSVSNFPATQPVSGPLTDTQLRATAVPVSDGSGSLTVDIASAAWSNFYVDYTSSDGTGDHTVIAAPGAGYKLQFQECTEILGEAGENIIIIKHGATAVKKLPFALQGEGYMRVWSYPDYLTLAENTALVMNNSSAKKWTVFGQYRVVAV